MVSAGKNWTLQCWSVVVWMSWLMVAWGGRWGQKPIARKLHLSSPPPHPHQQQFPHKWATFSFLGCLSNSTIGKNNGNNTTPLQLLTLPPFLQENIRHISHFNFRDWTKTISLDWTNISKTNKLANLEAKLVRNYDQLTHSLTDVKCRATSVAKNSHIFFLHSLLAAWSWLDLN